MGPTTYTHTALNCPATTIGPKVRAGFKDPPVIGPAINTPQASANPTASGATPAGALSSVATEMITNIRMKVPMSSAIAEPTTFEPVSLPYKPTSGWSLPPSSQPLFRSAESDVPL